MLSGSGRVPRDVSSRLQRVVFTFDEEGEGGGGLALVLLSETRLVMFRETEGSSAGSGKRGHRRSNAR